MRVANAAGRLSLVADDRVLDVERASEGRFGPDPQAVFESWEKFRAWARMVEATGSESAPLLEGRLGNPVPAPRQVFAIGLNYAEHAAESPFEVPEIPSVFTKYPTSLTGPYGEIVIPEGEVSVDWEVELVAVLGRYAHRVPEAAGWEYVAGLAVGQDISERRIQLAGQAPQFSMGKSYPGFGPIGPWLVTPDELDNRDDLELGCYVNGEQVQKGRTADMVFNVPQLISRLSAITPLLPGDVIFTGTPSGVGMGRTPPRYLSAGDELATYITGVGRMSHRFVAPGV
jgi:2-keto-4-pentenoate hydratase/2-oxohepta-3-ene-1,7-dioic acid hydratase in catechol pathway